ncbi:uncharacterized protein LOC124843205 [Vigna umbellata]|uniref:uncharacterized protein LOC124843205 n=1 Tax=Vigna umbellata TaxID=87088 RepID=UPI001F5F3676|nr:uncharacterized protein LOC124843205 [Vigna umbellata]
MEICTHCVLCRTKEDLSSKKGQASCGFMSSGFILAVIGAALKLSKICVSFSLFSILSEIVFSFFSWSWCMLSCVLCDNIVKPSVSMRLRSKRTYCGVECYGCFHIQRFSYLFIFLRGDLT